MEPPVNLDEIFPVLTAEVDCTGFNASVSAGFTTKVGVTVSVGLIAAGTIIPPVISELAIYAELDGDLATLDVEASATGTFATGKVTLYSVDLVGTPGLLTVGLWNLQESGCGQTSPSSKGDFAPADSSLTLSVLPGITSSGNVTGKLYPELRLEISAFERECRTQRDRRRCATVDGGVNVGAGRHDLSVNFGALGSLFGESGFARLHFISGNVTYPLYSGKWDLYNNCFEASGTKHAEAAAPASSELARRADLTCPTSSSFTSIEKIIDQIVSAVEDAFGFSSS
ncbi:hypothetical protein B0H17DRAFT_1191655 [Mycena rosella]|uniref:Uncharacterized protein n=1 Tax=Mycena rosella TaxID=1033263 RepID=A0AAD7GYU5_MYCRO|nr:hypothetical protein B0H17DRAFT_1191655 [Mycena rosella]